MNNLVFDDAGDDVVPRYFLDVDHGWLQSLVDEYLRHEGRIRGELDRRLLDPLPIRAPFDKQRIARGVLDRIWAFPIEAAVPPKRARECLFTAAGQEPDRERAVTLAARELGVASEALLQSLFADLRDERRVRAPKPVLPVAELARHANLALVSSLIKRALAITIEGDAALRPVVRQAKLRGLLCTVEAPRGPRAPERLSISGPFALFHRTTLYGRALASIVPLAARCPGMVLRATCNLEGRERTVVVRAGDPLPVSPTGRRFDSKLEERFFRDMTRAAPDWDLLREPRAIPAGGTLVFPDFELQHRRAPTRRWLLEIAGFWTPSYIADKLAPLRAAHLDHFILCIDEARNCAPEELPSHARVVRYDKRIDPAAILAIIDP